MAPQPQGPDRKTFLAAVTTVAAVYVYFLIFAQFGFLHAVRAQLGESAGVLRPLMAMMGAAGIAGSVVVAAVGAGRHARRWLWAGFVACAIAAVGSIAWRSFAGFGLTAMLAGFGVGLATVTLAGVLRSATGDGRLGVIIGLGTGLAYGFCNLPGIFNAGATTQAALAIGAAIAGLAASRALRPRFDEPRPRGGDYSGAGVAAWVLIFLALVCLDSALFYFIQHTADLKQGLWTGAGRQGLNAGAHVGAAVLAGWALDRQWSGRTALVSAGALLVASLWIGGRHAGYPLGALVYIASVSAYSTTLVFYPARSGRPAVAALVYAVAGWGGSALGIGLIEGRASLPLFLPAGAAALLAISLLGRYFTSRQG